MNDLLVIFSFHSEVYHENKTKFVTRDRGKMIHSCKRVNAVECHHYFYMCSDSIQHYGPDTYENARKACHKSGGGIRVCHDIYTV